MFFSIFSPSSEGFLGKVISIPAGTEQSMKRVRPLIFHDTSIGPLTVATEPFAQFNLLTFGLIWNARQPGAVCLIPSIIRPR